MFFSNAGDDYAAGGHTCTIISIGWLHVRLPFERSKVTSRELTIFLFASIVTLKTGRFENIADFLHFFSISLGVALQSVIIIKVKIVNCALHRY